MKIQKKAAKKDTLDVVIYAILAALLVLAGVLAWMYYDRHVDAKPLKVQVFLDNRCELFDDAFMAVSEPDGRRSYFDKGVAILETSSRSRIFVKSSDRYPDFHFESSRFKAESKVVITTQCGDRIDQTLDAMREQFKNRQR
jgi:hypothetical protein